MSSLRKSALPTLNPLALQPTGSEGIPSADASCIVPEALPPAAVLAPGESPTSQSAGDQGLVWRPTEAQQRVKARFWSRWADAGGASPSLAVVKQMTQSAAVGEWWGKPGFQAWFLNTSVTEERLAYLLHLSLSAAEDILLATDPKSQGARVAMVKVVAEMAGKLGKAAAPTGAAGQRAGQLSQVASMSREDLIRLLQDSGLKVEQTVNLPVSLPAELPSSK